MTATELTPPSDDEAYCTNLMVRWLQSGQTGCKFASHFAKQKLFPLAFTGKVDPAQLDLLHATLDKASDIKKAIVAMFPDLRTEEEIAELIDAICRHDRWWCKTVPWKDHPREDVLIGLNWETSAGHRTCALGLAPLGRMPIVRRAPFVGLVVWAGGLMNPYRIEDKGRVGLIDMHHDLPPEKYKDWWDLSQAETARRLAGRSEGAAHPNISFCLSASAAARITRLDKAREASRTEAGVVDGV